MTGAAEVNSATAWADVALSESPDGAGELALNTWTEIGGNRYCEVVTLRDLATIASEDNARVFAFKPTHDKDVLFRAWLDGKGLKLRLHDDAETPFRVIYACQSD